MPFLSELRYRLRAVFRRGALERDLDSELRLHLERETDKLVARGLTRADAERQARIALGGVERTKDDDRDARGIALLDTVAQDLRYAVRGLRARPAFAAGVILTLGLGIGANAAMFGITDRILFRAPAMLRDQSTVHRLYRLSVTDDGERVDRNLSFPTYLDVRQATPAVFSTIAAFQTRTLAMGDGENARERSVTVASAAFFDFFDATPALGRFFTAAEDSLPAGQPVIVLGWNYWMSEFGGRSVLGQPLRVGRVLMTIIGVAPRDFVGMSDQGVPAAFMPITTFAQDRLGNGYERVYRNTWLEIIARRRPGVSEDQARTVLASAFSASWRNAFDRDPRFGSPETLRIRAALSPVQMGRGPQAGRDARVAAWVSGVSLIVLLIACANVANLMLARAVSRRREVAMRLALGVSRERLVRQLLTESAVIAVAGGVTGLLVAQWGGATIRTLYLPSDLSTAVFTDGRTLAFATLATAAAALFTGLVPALRAGRGDVITALKAGEREGGDRRAGLRRGLLVFQAALSVLLLVGAGLFVSSLTNARDLRLGYDADRVIVAEVTMRGLTMDTAQAADLKRRMLATTQSSATITKAALGQTIPFYSNSERNLWVPGIDSVSRLGRFLEQQTSADYFATVGTRILRGRALSDDDRAGSPLVMVVSEGMARAIWPGQEPLGKCIHVDAAPAPDAQHAPCTTVVGVAEEARMRRLTDAREFMYYVSLAQMTRNEARYVIARTDGDAAAQAVALRARLQPLVPVPAYVTVTPLSRMVNPNFRAWQFGATMFAAFGGLALVIAAIGLYSLIAYDVAQRTREMSLRIALGAPVSRVIRMVIGNGVALVGGGILAGLAAAALIAPRLKELMFRVEPRDPVIFAGVALTLLLVSVVATAWPAMKAARVDPASVLRGD